MNDNRVRHLFTQCATCRVCSGAAHQTPPVLGVFSDTAKYLVIAQNPGEIKSNDRCRQWWIDEFNGGLDVSNIKLFYEWDFMTSGAYNAFSEIFGDGWLRSGEFSYTNAVRCRTPKNAAPSQDMIDACKTYTRSVILMTGITRIITVGHISTEVMVGKAFTWGKITQRGSMRVMPIMHYAAPSYDKLQTIEFVRRFMESVK